MVQNVILTNRIVTYQRDNYRRHFNIEPIYIYLHTAAAKIKTIETKRNTFKMQLKNQQRIGKFFAIFAILFCTSAAHG